jgi:hypothetical protein
VKVLESRVSPAFVCTTGAALALSLVLAPVIALGTGLATCDSGPQEKWQPQDVLEQQLVAKGWKVNRIKIDGGCYEVYALDENGKRVEAYFHPQTLAPVPTKEH